MTSRLTAIRALRARGDTALYLREAMAYAGEAREDVEAQIEAAYACDAFGEEERAIGYYDAAWALGIPGEKRREFLVGFGSTLRNVGRLEESMAILEAAIEEFPAYLPFKPFLALTLHDARQHHRALAVLLDALLDATSGRDALDGYQHALRHYRSQLKR